MRTLQSASAIVVLAALTSTFLVNSAVGAPGGEQSSGKAKAMVSVDFSKSEGKWLPADRFNNFSGTSSFAAQRDADVAFYNKQGLHGKIYRVWIRAQDIYDPNTGKYNYDKIDDYLRNASTLSDSLLGVMDTRVAIRDMHYTPEQIKPIIKKIMHDLKARFPHLVYIEAFNEPDYNLAKAITPEQLYDYYKVYYQSVNEINEELRPKVPLRIGGPAFMMFDEEWLRPFLDAYKADPSPGKRLDFISWHAYGEFPGGFHGTQGPRAYHFYKGNPSEVADQRAKLDADLRARSLDVNTPAFITELGIYPGPSFDHADDPHADYLIQAAGVSSLIYWFLQQPNTIPFNWVLRHGAEERKDQLISRVGKGKPIPTGIFTPYGNSMLMMSKLKDERVAAKSDALVQGKGIYAIATRDKTGAAIMLWNYQHVDSTSYDVNLNMANMQSKLRGKVVCQRMYRIDDKVSNYWGDPTRANLQQISARRVKVWQRYSVKIDLTPNALELISFSAAVDCPK